jgi:SAM-dependent methyltransferase
MDSKDLLSGKTILELGPGGSLGFGLLALEAGAKKYIAIDDGQHAFINQRQIWSYRALLGNDEDKFKRYFIPAGESFMYNPARIEFAAIDQRSHYSIPDQSIDIIYSCAVLEHVHDLELCFAEMLRVLKSGGRMYHEVDLRDHIFSQRSLWFLTLSDFWFRLLFKNTGGYVNRRRLGYYKKLIEKNGFSILQLQPTILHTDTINFKEIESSYSKEDIRVLSFISVLQKKYVN